MDQGTRRRADWLRPEGERPMTDQIQTSLPPRNYADLEAPREGLNCEGCGKVTTGRAHSSERGWHALCVECGGGR